MGKSLITGYYGMNNYGDDLFSLLTYQAIKKYNISSDCRILSPKLREDDNLKYSCFSFFKHGYSHLNKYGTLVRVLNILMATRGKVDNIFFSGGSLYSRGDFSTADLMYKKKDCKFHALGVSVGPYENTAAEKKVINNLKLYSYISLRDQMSYDRVCSYNLDAKVVLAGDLAGLGVDLIEKEKKTVNKKKKIGFSPCWINDQEKMQSYVNHFYKKISCIKDKGNYQIIILCLNENLFNGDINLCRQVEKKLKLDGFDCEIVYYTSLGVSRTWNEIRSFDFYFTVRLHGAITAYLTETPFYLYEYHEKCTEFLKFIKYNFNINGLNLNQDVRMDGMLSVNQYSTFSKLNFIEHPYSRLIL
jgi:polysaccharide pyruvyl transferase WcaK-like protein